MNKDHVEQVAGQLQQLKGSDLWVSLSFVERHKGKHQAHRKRVEDSLRHTLPLLQLCLDNHGRVAVEGPKKAHVWNHKLWKDFESANGLKRVSFDGCMLGFEGDHYPKHCTLCVATNSFSYNTCLSTSVMVAMRTSTTKVRKRLVEMHTQCSSPKPLRRLSSHHMHSGACHT